MKMKSFKSFTEYEQWADSFDGCWEYEDIPCIINDGWKIAADMMIECKSHKTALRRFAKTFNPISDAVATWTEGMKESCETGCFHDAEQSYPEGGTYSWGVEEVSDNLWYVYLNISGSYAE